MSLRHTKPHKLADKPAEVFAYRCVDPQTFSVGGTADTLDDLVAQDAGCSAVAFPTPAGMHLMSNHMDVESYIRKRYIAWPSNRVSPSLG